jgi:hypothetical protein
MTEQIKLQDNSTFSNFQKIYTELRQGFYKIYYKFEKKDPKPEYYYNPEQDIRLKFHLLAEILPKIESLSDPQLFFKQLESKHYGETNPLLLNYLTKYPNLETLLDSLNAQGNFLNHLNAEELKFIYLCLTKISSTYLGTNNFQEIVKLQTKVREKLGSIDVDLLYK